MKAKVLKDKVVVTPTPKEDIEDGLTATIEVILKAPLVKGQKEYKLPELGEGTKIISVDISK